MTSLADRLVARATDRGSAVQPVISPLYASWARDAGPAGAPSALDALFETPVTDETPADRPHSPSGNEGAAGTPQPRTSTPGARRQTLDEWLTANAPEALTVDRTRAARGAVERADGDMLSLENAADEANGGRSAVASARGSQGADDARAHSDQAAPHVSRPSEAAREAPSNRERNRLQVTSEAFRQSKGATAEGPAGHPHRGAVSNVRAVRQATPPHDAAPPVQITIGRVVVRAVLPNAPQAAPAPVAPAPPAGSTLAEYLARGRRP